MGFTRYGKVDHGAIVFDDPVPLPDGTPVVVRVEAEAPQPITEVEPGPDFASLPFFGMWANRDDLPESADWVRERRQQWHQRASRTD